MVFQRRPSRRRPRTHTGRCRTVDQPWRDPLMRKSLLLAFAILVALSCDENLPTGPQTFVAQLKIAVVHDTVVVGDTNVAQAQAFDASGNRIQSLSFLWTAADPSVIGLASPNPDTSSGRTRRLVGQKPGNSGV